MGEGEKPTSWWQTLPGVLTAIAAVIGAVSGLIIALKQAGVFDAKEEPAPPKAAIVPQIPAPPPAQPQPQPRPQPPAAPVPAPVTRAEPAPAPVRQAGISIPCPTPRSRLRAESAVLSDEQVRRMVAVQRFFDVNLNPGSPGFPNEFKPRQLGGDAVVIDYATCLMWKQSASPGTMTWYEAPGYAGLLNEQRYAGYADWRLPTIEELASLMEPRKGGGGAHLDSVFDLGPGKAVDCWSVDRKQYATSADTAWPAGFSYGGLSHGGFAGNRNRVLAVRSMR